MRWRETKKGAMYDCIKYNLSVLECLSLWESRWGGREIALPCRGKMRFSVTTAFSVHNLSHGALWGMCLSLPPTGRGQNQSRLIVELAFTVSLMHVSLVYLSHQKGQATPWQKGQWRMFVGPRIGLVGHFEHCCLLFGCSTPLSHFPFVFQDDAATTRTCTVCQP